MISICGWLVLSPGSRKLATGLVPGVDRKLVARVEALPMFLALAVDYNRWVAPLEGGVFDDWSYCYRKSRIANSAWSDHSSGAAVDFNSAHEGSQNLRNKEFFAQPDKVKAISRLKRIYPLLIWGGDYRDAFYDPMHWAIKPGVSPAQVAALVLKLGISQAGVRSKNRFGLPLLRGIKPVETR